MGLPPQVKVIKGSEKGKLVEATVEGRKKLKPNEVAMRITHSGVCGTDLHHLVHDLVLGHEGVGVVEAVGEQVTKFQLGDRVGFGYVRDGCGECDHCKAGDIYYCDMGARMYGVSDFDQGSFADYATWPDTNLHKIPDNIPSAVAPPFLCAGMTVFTPMRNYGIKPGHRVGIIGIGGLGHIAIQFAAKLGAEVVVFSGSENKRKEAMDLGAKEFWVTKDLADNKKPEKGLDYLLITATKHPDWATFFDLMNPFGDVILLGLTTEDLVIPYFPLMLREISIHGSLSSKPKQIDEMLAFASEHGVRPIVEEFPMTEEGAAQAIDKLVSGTIRYRGVLKA
ncbi:GroES-like protein [Rhizodiscina lignyota]|uniref:GroES-like protein n=1 Tax=Rhizodiscina lignyota TaxID=1504668 RepID=A0A9P4M6U1_9PEZI|nr:GroES-like protein [Rhizodiscina lignyota]